MNTLPVWPEAPELEALCTWLTLHHPMPRFSQSALRAVTRLSELSQPRDVSRSAVAAMRARLMHWRERHHGSLVLFHDRDYPSVLREIARPPAALFIEGEVRALQRTGVAIVGSRAATPEYVAWTRDTAGDLVRAGLVVGSGLARGIDAAAHRGALDAGGPTFAVLGTGTDVVYPPEHADLQRDVLEHGCVVSELPPGTPVQAWHFPSRNRILAGLTAAVVVVQAEKRSGALITARHALSESRDVMAVPGHIADPRSAGTHELLRQGAALVEAAPDVVQTLGWRPHADSGADANPGAAVLALLQRPRPPDDLRATLGWDPVTFQRALAELELGGWIELDAQGRIRLAQSAR